MKSFKIFLKEYLTPKQKEKFIGINLTPEAKKATDHFFGPNNDIIHGELDSDAGHIEHKSEIHKAIERHLGKELSPSEYVSGQTKDKYGRDIRLGRLIKDEKLRNQYASDVVREGSKKGSKFKTSTVRGIEVAGQTNSAPNEQHPNGHSWGEISCKNVDTGVNNHYLEYEIKNGTVVHRVHDHNGQEIYRATLHPYENDRKERIYGLDSEYGIKNPAFTRSAQDVAKKLSGEYKPGVFDIHPDVYNDSFERILHPSTTPEHITKALDDENSVVRLAAIQHPNATPEHISKALDDENSVVRIKAIEHPNATPEHINKALYDDNRFVRREAIKHPKATKEHIDKALNDSNMIVRANAIRHPNATKEHIDEALNDINSSVRYAAIEHPNATSEHISKALNDELQFVKRHAIKHPNVTSEHISKALDDKDWEIRDAAIEHPNATVKHIDKALDDESEWVRETAVQHSKATKEHIDKALDDKYVNVRYAAIKHPNVTKEHITKALNDTNSDVRTIAQERLKEFKK